MIVSNIVFATLPYRRTFLFISKDFDNEACFLRKDIAIQESNGAVEC